MHDDNAPHVLAEPDFGILLGWRIDPAGERLAVKLQSASRVPERDEDVREYRYFLSREQAVQLANNLFQHAGTTPPREPGVFRKLFG